VIVYHVETGERLDINELTHMEKQAHTEAAIIGAVAFLFSGANLAMPTSLILGALFGGLALAIGHLRIKDYKKAKKFYDERLKNVQVEVSGRKVRMSDGRVLTVVGRKEVHNSGKHKKTYMVWEVREAKPEDSYVFGRDRIYAPAYQIGEYFVIAIPPPKQYYLRIKKDIILESPPDKVFVHQDPEEVEYEFHYVAGKSRDARLEFRAHGESTVVVRANGLPFQKVITRAGSYDDLILLVLDRQRLTQTYGTYVSLIEKLGGPIMLASGKVTAILDYAFAPDKHAEVDAEFVKS